MRSFKEKRGRYCVRVINVSISTVKARKIIDADLLLRLVRRMASAMRFARNEALNLPESYSRLLDEADAILRAADAIRRAKGRGAE